MSSAVFLDSRQKNPSIMKLDDLKEKSKQINASENLKLNLLIRRIESEERGSGLSDELESFMFSQVGPALGLRADLNQIIEHVKANDLKVLSLLRRTSYATLGLEDPAQKKI